MWVTSTGVIERLGKLAVQAVVTEVSGLFVRVVLQGETEPQGWTADLVFDTGINAAERGRMILAALLNDEVARHSLRMRKLMAFLPAKGD